MKINICHIILLLSCLFFTSCKNDKVVFHVEGEDSNVNEVPKEPLTRSEYISWVEDPQSGLLVEKTIGDMSFALQFKPHEYILFKENTGKNLSQMDIDSGLISLGNMQYYTFRITVKNFADEVLKYKLKSKDEYYERVEYFSFKMQNDLQLIDGTDTLPCSMFLFERTYGVVPYLSFSIGFPTIKKEGNKTLVFNESIFENGPIKISFIKESLSILPKYKI